MVPGLFSNLKLKQQQQQQKMTKEIHGHTHTQQICLCPLKMTEKCGILRAIQNGKESKVDLNQAERERER